MKEITILETFLVIILLLMPILAAYLAWRTFKLKKSVELLRIDRNDLIEEKARQSNNLRLKGIEMDEVNKEKFILSELDRKIILNALKMPEYKKAIDEPETRYQVRKAYMMLKEKIRVSLKD